MVMGSRSKVVIRSWDLYEIIDLCVAMGSRRLVIHYVTMICDYELKKQGNCFI